MLSKVIFVLLIIRVSDISCLKKGSVCPVYETGEKGTCALLLNCPDLIPAARKRLPMTRCGFQGVEEIICCPKDSVRVYPSEDVYVPKERKNPNPELRISQKKCEEYTVAVFRPSPKVAHATNDTIVVLQDFCGFNVNLAAQDGPVKLNEFPHLAFIGTILNETSVRWQCLGSLISEKFVLTTTSCISNGSGAKAVRVGVVDVPGEIDLLQYTDLYVKNIHSHDTSAENQKSCHDIALLEFHDAISFNERVRPACLPKVGGRTSAGMFVSANLLDHSVPDHGMLQNQIISNYSHMRCLKEQEKPCENQLTGGLFEYHSTQYCMYNVLGIAPRVAPCNTEVYPIFVRIFRYIDWIEKIVWGNHDS